MFRELPGGKIHSLQLKLPLGKMTEHDPQLRYVSDVLTEGKQKVYICVWSFMSKLYLSK